MAIPISNRHYLLPAERCAEQFGDGLLFVGWQENSGADVRYAKDNGFHTIAWNLEPLFFTCHYQIIAFLQEANECFDYSPLNLNILRLYGVNAKFKMVAPNCTFYDQKEKDIDLLFIGTQSDRRSEWVNKISLYHDVTWVQDVAGDEYWDLCSRSKVILNIKNDPINPQETVRISPLLASGSCVVSEVSQINHYGDGLLEYHEHNYFEVIRRAIKDYKEIATTQQLSYYEHIKANNW